MSLFLKIKNAVDSKINSIKEKRKHRKKENEGDASGVPEISDVDRTIAKIKSEKRNVNDRIRQSKNESAMYLEKSKEERGKGNTNLAIRYFKMHQDREDKICALQNTLITLDEQIDAIKAGDDAKDLMDVLTTSAACMEDLQKSMGSTEEVRRKVDKLKELEDYIHEVNDIQDESLEEPNVDDIMKEVDEGLSKDMLEELDSVSVPTTIPDVETANTEEKENSEEKRVPVLEEE